MAQKLGWTPPPAHGLHHSSVHRLPRVLGLQLNQLRQLATLPHVESHPPHIIADVCPTQGDMLEEAASHALVQLLFVLDCAADHRTQDVGGLEWQTGRLYRH